MMVSKILYISLEFVAVFSGNGVLARSQVRSLARLPQVSSIVVVCGRPRGYNVADDDFHTSDTRGVVHIHSVEVPVWKTLDRPCSWQAFAALTSRIVLHQHTLTPFDAALGVDWTSLGVYLALTEPPPTTPLPTPPPPFTYLNFRVYHAMAGITASDRAFYVAQETHAVRAATRTGGGVVCLCAHDEAALAALLGASEGAAGRTRRVHPCLRQEALDAGVEAAREEGAEGRVYVACLVRLAREKGALRFVEVVERLGTGFWEGSGVVPFLCGAEADGEYAGEVRRRLRAVCGSARVEEFLSARELLEVMERCVLNFHPALYEAFGMTIVECAAMGCPSVIHTGQVGASELLPTKEGMTIAVDMTDLDSAAVVVRELLTSRRDYLRQVGEKARNRALAWDEDSHAHSIYSFLSGDDK